MSKRLFVGNLSFEVSESELKELFAPFGVGSATIPTRESGKPKGFGFVDVSVEQAGAAIKALNGKEINGRTIAVSEASPRPEVSYWGNSTGRRDNNFRGGGRGRW